MGKENVGVASGMWGIRKLQSSGFDTRKKVNTPKVRRKENTGNDLVTIACLGSWSPQRSAVILAEIILVWPTSWTPAVGGLFVSVWVCVSADMSPYCSAHDEWLIMKLCMYVVYHDANNGSNFGGDPVTELHFFKRFIDYFADGSSLEGYTSLNTALVTMASVPQWVLLSPCGV